MAYTRHFDRFDVDKTVSILAFRRYLEGVSGKSKLETVAKAIATDVSKFYRR